MYKGFTYHTDSRNKNILRCSIRKETNCQGMLKFKDNYRTLLKCTKHTCGLPNFQNRKYENFLNECKKKSKESTEEIAILVQDIAAR